MIEIIQNIVILIFIFFTSFFWHEPLHIKGQGLRNTGIINVEEFGMTCGASHVISGRWFSLSGGILTSIVMFIMCLCSTGFWQWTFLTLGFAQLFYGLYEGFAKKNIPYQRYTIYVLTIVIFMLIWVIK